MGLDGQQQGYRPGLCGPRAWGRPYYRSSFYFHLYKDDLDTNSTKNYPANFRQSLRFLKAIA